MPWKLILIQLRDTTTAPFGGLPLLRQATQPTGGSDVLPAGEPDAWF